MLYRKEKMISQADKQEWMLGLFALVLTCLVLLQLKISCCEETVKVDRSPQVIVIDPGHGGKDPGKIGSDGTMEKTLNLQVAKQLEKLLKKRGYKVVMTRSKDVTATGEVDSAKTDDLRQRIACTEKAKASLCVSIHMNSYPEQNPQGAQVFYYEGNLESRELAHQIQAGVNEWACPGNRRQESGNSSYYLLKNSFCTTVIVECGFLSNPLEAAKLHTKNYQKKLAEGICVGILNYFTS
ncbi:MAG: N-acetylmuramoyl-L-alanine amidase [Lachnospiraceae bacterium]|nr:N-acetylmuramoyl-L-alanine amidase [Lachnospiraceae bacterium]